MKSPTDPLADNDRPRGALPDRETLLAVMKAAEGPVTVSALARHFDLKGKDRTALRLMLQNLRDEGLIDEPKRRRFDSRERLPPTTVLEITGTDADGELLARPLRWPETRPAPAIFVAPTRGRSSSPAAGERILARLKTNSDGSYDATILRHLGAAPSEILGIYREGNGQKMLEPTDRRARESYAVAPGRHGDAEPGDLVRGRVLGERRHGSRLVEIVERLGSIDSPGAIGMIALHSQGIPIPFPEAALHEAEQARPPDARGRIDLQALPLVTIDDEDARDFDDAVHAESDPAPGNPGGFRITVAIADVAWYVRPGSALDREAWRRGNSVYLPDRVVPMLPEALSNDLCSLKPDQPRAALVARIRIDAEGRLIDHAFSRALIRSSARLTYRAVQTIHDHPESAGALLPEGITARQIEPLFEAYAALDRDRKKRGTLEIDLPERKVTIENGHITAIGTRDRLDSHRLIETFMIAANVAAAETLERHNAPCLYRVHESPDAARLEAVRGFIESFGLPWPRGQVQRAGQLAGVLAKASDMTGADVIHETILRCQAQAIYSPKNIGHFGLALRRYAHFTSPIRRYADLLVHRALIAALDLGTGGLPSGAGSGFEAAGEQVSMTERRAQMAEREAMERYLALYLKDRVGTRLPGRITGVTHFGLFIRLNETGAEGLVPMSLLGEERFDHDEATHALIGRVSGRRFSLGDDVDAEIRESDPITGGMVFALHRHRPMQGRKMPDGPHRPTSPMGKRTRFPGKGRGTAGKARAKSGHRTASPRAGPGRKGRKGGKPAPGTRR